MSNIQKLTSNESTAINIMKAISVLSVITAHIVSLSNTNLFTNIVSSFWFVFGEVGVIIFFVIGGFLYNRSLNDGKSFWKKKFFRIIIPWIVCSSLTYGIGAILSHNFSMIKYFKWIFGSGTWYYYIVIYTLFLFIFKWIYNNNALLVAMIVLQFISLILASFGLKTTIPLAFFTDYLNPLHWIGYFSLGILIKKHRLDITIRKKKYIVIIAYVLAALSFYFLFQKEIFTYFHIVSSLFCLSSMIIIADIAYKMSAGRLAKHIEKIGISSYCIYLLHMQIVQFFVNRIPNGIFKLLFSPFIGLGIMLILISIGLYICNKFPFGRKIKMALGL